MPATTAKSEPLWPFIAAAFAASALIAAYAAIVSNMFADWAQRGQFGDMFGALNTVFSGLAFAALAYTLNLQRKELGLQRQELASTREELAKQAAAQQQQANTALRSAEISALGALFQSYSQLLAGEATEKAVFIGQQDWHAEVKRVHDRLNHLLREAEVREPTLPR